MKFLWCTKSIYMSYFLGKVGLRIKNNDVIADPVSNPGAPSYLFNWGIEVMMRKYHAALDDIL